MEMRGEKQKDDGTGFLGFLPSSPARIRQSFFHNYILDLRCSLHNLGIKPPEVRVDIIRKPEHLLSGPGKLPCHGKPVEKPGFPVIVFRYLVLTCFYM